MSGGGVGGTLTACAVFSDVPVNVYDGNISVGGNNYTGSGSFLLTVKRRKNGSLQGGLLNFERRPTDLAPLQTNAAQSLSIIGNTGVIAGQAQLTNPPGLNLYADWGQVRVHVRQSH
jgi:hypothetical protein